MEYRKMDKLDAMPSLLGFGCMRLPETSNGLIDYPKAQKLIDLAMDNGVTYYDTAYPYHNGQSEVFLGQALKKYARESYYIATKMPVWLVQSKEEVYQIFEEQLARLNVSCIDFYLLHALDKDKWELVLKYDMLGILERFKQEGKIKFLGFSFHGWYDTFKRIIDYYSWDFCQIQYNYMDTEIQAGIKGYQLCQIKNIPVIVMEPNKGGALTTFADDIANIFKEYDESASLASWALRWVASHEQVKVILSGMSDECQVWDNLRIFNNYRKLSSLELELIEQVKKMIQDRVHNSCTNCKYCMPCPNGVDIPRNFAIWNHYGMFHSEHLLKHSIQEQLPYVKRASQCIACGACEKKCPQKIPIITNLKEAEECFQKHV